MQTTESENRKNKLLSDEESINFRPSPNFKHMKKYLKSKFEESNSPSTPNGNEDSSNYGHNDIQEKINESPSDIQPPLPPNPPPPDSPLQLNLKQEIEDDEYNDLTNSTSEMSGDTQTEELAKEYQTDQAEGEKGKQGEEIMCRNFIRGTCNRGASCIFVHKIILSQLNDVYRFCNDFQNSICVRKKCRFVHATVFEKEYFLRTAYLPPHTLNHLKENNVLQPPPPPPPQPEGVAPTDPAAATSVNNHPSLPMLAGVTSLPMMSCAPPASLDARSTVGDIFRAAASETNSLKREWAEVEDFVNSPREFDCGESAAKKCKNCDINEIRLQLIKNKAVKLKRSEEELNKKIFITCKKSNKLLAVLATLVKSMNSKIPGSARCLLTVSAEKEKVLQEQVPLLVSDNRMSLFREEANKNALNAGNVTFQSILTKLLLSSRDQSLSPDGS